jgi:hypothetical protein
LCTEPIKVDVDGHEHTIYAMHMYVTPKLFWRVADVKQEEVLTGPSTICAGKEDTDAADALFG